MRGARGARLARVTRRSARFLLSALASSLVWHAQVLGGVGRYGDMREVARQAVAEGEATHNPASER